MSNQYTNAQRQQQRDQQIPTQKQRFVQSEQKPMNNINIIQQPHQLKQQGSFGYTQHQVQFQQQQHHIPQQARAQQIPQFHSNVVNNIQRKAPPRAQSSFLDQHQVSKQQQHSYLNQQNAFSRQQQDKYHQQYSQQQYQSYFMQQAAPKQIPQFIHNYGGNNFQYAPAPQQGMPLQPGYIINNSFGNNQQPNKSQLSNHGPYNDDEFIEPVQLTGEAAKKAYDINTQITFKLAAMYKIGKLRKDQQQILPGMVSIQATDQQEAKELKVGVDLICVIDKSGSMQGFKLDMVKRTILMLLDFLTKNDRLCLVEFSDTAQRLTPLKKVTPENKQYFLNVVNDIEADGGTFIAEGTEIAFEQLKQRKYVNNVASIFLLSDGQDGSAEPRIRDQLKNYDQVFTIHSFGFGEDHDAQMMTKLCNLRNGSFYFVNDVTLLDEFFVDALGGLVSVIVDQIKISVRCVPYDPFQDIKVSKVYGNQWKTLIPNRIFQISIPHLAAGSRKDYVFELSLPKFQALIGDHQRQVSIIQARLELRSTQTQQVIYKDAELQLTFFNENEPNPINEQDLDVATQYYRVKGADVIDDARRACEFNQFHQAQFMIDSLIQNIKNNSQVAGKSLATLQDLQQAKQASQPQQFQSFGSKQMAQMSSNNYAQQGVNAIFSAQGIQMQSQQQSVYQNKQQSSYMQQVQQSKMSR